MADLTTVHDRLRNILRPYGDKLQLTKDGPEGLTLEIPGLEGKPWGYVAGTRLGKRYVSYYLMPVYESPGALETMSPALRRRMQGKSCFNFSSIDESLFEELAAVTAQSIPGFEAKARAIRSGPGHDTRRQQFQPPARRI
jgi:hypothetical protein